MVPVFSIESLISIQWIQYSFYFQAIREIYETYAIYSFMRYLMYYLGDAGLLARRLAAMPASMGTHKPPFCFLTPWTMGAEFLKKCRTGVFQFVVVRFCLVVSGLTLKSLGIYHEGHFSTRSLHLYFTLANGLSQAYALYSLFMFYHCTNKELKGIRPFTKFLCIKLVIFFSWWQGLGIFILVRSGQIISGHGHSANEIASLIQRLLVGMEMLIASIGYFYAFPVSEVSGYSTDFLGFSSFNSTITSPYVSPSKAKLRLPRIQINNNSSANKNDNELDQSSIINKSCNEHLLIEENIDDVIDNTKDTKTSSGPKTKKYVNEKDLKVSSIFVIGTFVNSFFSSNEDNDKKKNKINRKKKEDDDNNSEKSSNSYEVSSLLIQDKNSIIPHVDNDVESLSDVGNDETSNSKVNPNQANVVYSSQGKSFSRGKHTYVRVRKVSADATDEDDDLDDVNNNNNNNINQSPTSVSSRDRSNSSRDNVHSNDFTMLLALWTASMPAELQEDLSDLGTQMTDLVIQSPYIAIKKLIKSQFNSDSIS
jgi:hypothetical protein